MEYKKGLRVRHPIMPDWGLGEVLEDSIEDKVKIFFVGSGEKALSLKGLDLTKVEGTEAKHPLLDNLVITTDQSLRYRSLPQSIQGFLDSFPGGFYGDKFASNERDYKLKAHHQMVAVLSQDTFNGLLKNGDYEEIYQRAFRFVTGTNLIHLHEKLALKNGLTANESKRRFAEVLYTHLFGNGDIKKRFNDLCEFLEEIKAGKWTIATYFLFTMFPNGYMFVKPTITKNSADICGYDIRYRSDLNWETYEAVLRFSEFLKNELEALKPRDMIDVQSFMWCIRPDKAGTSQGKKKSKQTETYK